MANKARYWVAVLYNENMLSNWIQEIGDLLQYPYAYCVHDKDTLEDSEDSRKVHTHIILAFPNTTTYNNAYSIFDKLSAPGKKALNKIESIASIRNMYEYLIHNTETCRKKDKFLYPNNERITGNNFDIGSYEQLSIADKDMMAEEIADYIYSENINNFMALRMWVRDNLGSEYLKILKTYSGYFERLIKGMHYLNKEN